MAARAPFLLSSSGLDLFGPLHGPLEQLHASLLVAAGTPVKLQETNWKQEVKDRDERLESQIFKVGTCLTNTDKTRLDFDLRQMSVFRLITSSPTTGKITER